MNKFLFLSLLALAPLLAETTGSIAPMGDDQYMIKLIIDNNEQETLLSTRVNLEMDKSTTITAGQVTAELTLEEKGPIAKISVPNRADEEIFLEWETR